MKIFKKKEFIKKLIFALIIILLCSTMLPKTISYAASDDTSLGGKLLKPIMDFIVGLGDVIMDFMHSMLIGSGDSVIRVDLDNNLLDILITVIVALAVAALVLLVATYTAGTVVPVLAKAIAAVVGTTASATSALSAVAVGAIAVTSIKAGVVAGIYAHSSWFGSEAVLTLYQITPEEIFSGELDILNANFFSTQKSSKPATATSTTTVYESTPIDTIRIKDRLNITNNNQCNSATDKIKKELEKKYGYKRGKPKITITYKKTDSYNDYNAGKANGTDLIEFVGNDSKKYKVKIIIAEANSSSAYAAAAPNLYIVDLLIYSEVTSAKAPESIVQSLKPMIAKWYYTIRNISIVAMMPILVYIGIRMLLTSIASEKSKYKSMLQDWVIAFCLMFVMQYIMSFSMNIVDNITKLVNSATGDPQEFVVVNDENGKIQKALEDADLWNADMSDGNDNILWPTKNVMGLIRTQASVEKGGSYLYIGYGLAFIILVWYTVFFVFTYIKRIIYLAFLTVIAPLVAMTYPIDKINDGKAQAFDMWLKEYIFNLLIQPFHLLLYTLLISMAYELATTNVIYTLVALGFLMPAEKLLRKFFGFEKAQTPGVLGGAAGAALMMNGLNHIFKRRPPAKDGKDYLGGEKDKSEESAGIDTSNINDSYLFSNENQDQQFMSQNNDDIATSRLTSGQDNINTTSFGNDQQDYDNGNDSFMQSVISNGAPTSTGDNDSNSSLPDSSGGVNDPFFNRTSGFGFYPNTNPNIARNRIRTYQDGIANGNARDTNLEPRHTPVPRRNITRPKVSRLRGLKSAGQNYIGQRLNRTVRNVQSGKGIRRIGEMATGAFVGAGAGLLGASLGIASGDLSKVGQYGAGAAAGGYALGSRRSNTKVDEEEVRAAYQRGYYGDMNQYKKEKLKEKREKFLNDDKKVREFQELMNYKSEKEAKKKLEEYSKTIDAGITDVKDIATVVNLHENEGWSLQKSMTTAKTYKKFGKKISDMDSKETDELKFKISNKAKAQNVQNVDRATEQAIKDLKIFEAQKGSLDKVILDD